MEERTGCQGQSESQTGEKKWQTCWCCRGKMAQASTEKLEHTGPAEKESVALNATESSWHVRRSCLFQKEKEQSRLSRGPDRKVHLERVKMSEGHTLARDRRIRAEAWRGKRGLHSKGRQVPRRRRWRASNKSFPRTGIRKHERMSECKSSPERSEESWFHSKSGQT